MGCWHGGYHGCGSWYGPPYGWREPAEWYMEPPMSSRLRRSYRRAERQASAEDLEAQLTDLREEMRRVESDLADLLRMEKAAADEPSLTRRSGDMERG